VITKKIRGAHVNAHVNAHVQLAQGKGEGDDSDSEDSVFGHSDLEDDAGNAVLLHPCCANFILLLQSYAIVAILSHCRYTVVTLL
jgi:hypothetical protein